MAWRVTLLISYGLLFLFALAISLSGSLIMNVRPYYLHGDTGMAIVQSGLALGAALFPLGMECAIRWWWKVAGGVLFLILLFVCLGNGIESSTLVRGDLAATRQDKAFVNTSTNEQITKWTTEVETLKKTYTPRDEDELTAAQDRESIACKVATSNDCKTAQKDLAQVAHDLGLTKRVDRIESAIRAAQEELKALGAPPPDHLKEAANDADFLPINPLKHRPTLIAMACEGMAAIGMIFFVALLNSFFTKAFGPRWWEKNESPPESTPATSLNSQPVTSSPSAMATPAGPKRVLYAPGVEAWGNQVRLQPGQRGMVLSPSQALPYYHAFCESKGYPSCKLGLFGSILRQECGFTLVKKVGGVGYYEFNVKPPSTSKVIALVREMA